MDATAIILAAGYGKRLGGTPKALARLGRYTFIERVAITVKRAGCRNIVAVVLREIYDEVRRLIAAPSAVVVVNTKPELGMFFSVQLGLEAVTVRLPETKAVLIFPVDHPLVHTATVKRMLDAAETMAPDVWLQPVYEGEAGHPIVLPQSATTNLLMLSSTLRLDRALSAAGLSPRDISVSDPHVLSNINTYRDLQAAFERWSENREP